MKSYQDATGLKGGPLKAWKELLALGCPVIRHGARHDEGYFVISAEHRTIDDSLWADYYQEEVREQWNEDRTKILNASGIRTKVHDILSKYDLYAEWVNPGMVAVYDR